MSLDYGMRISIEGEDVKTCDDVDTIVNSKYANFKGSVRGSGSYTFEQTETPIDSFVITIAHNLGYIPIVFARMKFLDWWVDEDIAFEFNGSCYCEAEVGESGVTSGILKVDDTNIYLDITVIGMIETTYYYWYEIFLDKAKI